MGCQKLSKLRLSMLRGHCLWGKKVQASMNKALTRITRRIHTSPGRDSWVKGVSSQTNLSVLGGRHVD